MCNHPIPQISATLRLSGISSPKLRFTLRSDVLLLERGSRDQPSKPPNPLLPTKPKKEEVKIKYKTTLKTFEKIRLSLLQPLILEPFNDFDMVFFIWMKGMVFSSGNQYRYLLLGKGEH
jgi:hypothetical protein